METRSIAAVWESRLTRASCPELGMGDVHVMLAVPFNAGEGLARGDALDAEGLIELGVPPPLWLATGELQATRTSRSDQVASLGMLTERSPQCRVTRRERSVEVLL